MCSSPMDALTRLSRVSYACAFGATTSLVYKIVISGELAFDYDGPKAVKCRFHSTLPLRATADAEIKVPFIENPELTNVLPLKLAVGQNLTMHASPAARNFFNVLISTLLLHSPSLNVHGNHKTY